MQQDTKSVVYYKWCSRISPRPPRLELLPQIKHVSCGLCFLIRSFVWCQANHMSTPPSPLRACWRWAITPLRLPPRPPRCATLLMHLIHWTITTQLIAIIVVVVVIPITHLPGLVAASPSSHFVKVSRTSRRNKSGKVKITWAKYMPLANQLITTI